MRQIPVDDLRRWQPDVAAVLFDGAVEFLGWVVRGETVLVSVYEVGLGLPAGFCPRVFDSPATGHVEDLFSVGEA